MYDPKYNRKSYAICNVCFVKSTKDADGRKIDVDCTKWEINYGLSRSTSKYINHLSSHHKEISEAYDSSKVATAVAGGGTVDSHYAIYAVSRPKQLPVSIYTAGRVNFVKNFTLLRVCRSSSLNY